MSAIVELDFPNPSATDGEIAAINLDSARRSAWVRFAQDARLPGAAEAVVDQERLTAQYFGDLDALDRLEALASQFSSANHSFSAALVEAEVASTVHRFDDARGHLARGPPISAARARWPPASSKRCTVEAPSASISAA